MYSYRSLDGILIKVGENAKENDALTESSYPNEWWLHADGGAGSHVVICHDTILFQRRREEMRRCSPYIIAKTQK